VTERKHLSTPQLLILFIVAAGLVLVIWNDRRDAAQSRAQVECEVDWLVKTGEETTCVYDERFNEWVPR
jgi:hypothetical protein